MCHCLLRGFHTVSTPETVAERAVCLLAAESGDRSPARLLTGVVIKAPKFQFRAQMPAPIIHHLIVDIRNYTLYDAGGTADKKALYYPGVGFRMRACALIA